MSWMEFVLGLLTLILGTGWLFTWRAHKKKNMGEAVQEEAKGWQEQQNTYRKTIEDLNGICDRIREDRDRVYEEKERQRKENEELRQNYAKMQKEIESMRENHTKQIADLRNGQARLGAKLSTISPFLCGRVGCLGRVKVTLDDNLEALNAQVDFNGDEKK